jgi:tetratricopeptide (TPR) repeat protein
MISKKLFALTICVSLMVAGCSVKKNNIISRNYHNTTARYNGYYHGRIKMKDAVDRLASLHEDKYDRILSVFRYADAQKAKSIFPDMDEVIKKVSLVISRHSMNIGGKERCRWIDDNWLLMGKAHFFKHDYFSAIETFEYIAASYPDQNTKYEALLWLTQTNIALTKFASCEFTLDYLKSEPKFPKSLRGELYAVLSDFYLQTRQYTQAIDALEKAVVFNKKRDTKIRLMFILAQVYQHENQYKKAFQHYTNCIHKNPPYEMGFNARINRARCFDSENKDSKEVKKELVKMLKDEKNKDYLDQVYYALAGLAIQEPDTPKAIEHLNSSIAASKGNNNQKAMSYLDLGKIYFSKHDYKLARAYYDSTMTVLSNDYYEYDLVLNRRNSLTKLMKNLSTIALEDSLQRLAQLPDEELKIKLHKLAQEQIEEELKKLEKAEMERQAKEQQLMPQGMPNVKDPFGNTESGGGWYFYNQQALSFGYNDFIKKWGQRKAEDNWRRVNKEAIIPLQSGEEEANADTTEKEDPNDPEVKKKKVDALAKKFLARIPTNQKMIEASNRKILDAYYSNGLIYKESLYDLPAAAETFSTMMNRFPDNKYMLQTYYHLYRIYLAMGNEEKSDFYKDILLNQYPESEYAMLIRNPDKANVTSVNDSLLNTYYEDTYKMYVQKQYSEVIQRKKTSDSLFPASPLMPKFDFLKTLAIGHTNPVPVFEASLNTIVKNYPEDPVKKAAQEILDAIHGKIKEEPKGTTQNPDSAAFTYSADTVHLVAVVIQVKNLNSNELRTKLSDYNNLYYSLRELKISAQQLDKDKPVILISDFPDKSSAQDYAIALKDDQSVFGAATPGSFELLVISAGNYVKLLKEKDIEKYLAFYDQNYF